MKHIVLALLLISTSAFSQGVVTQQELRATPEMSKRCVSSIGFYQDKVSKYELKVRLSLGQKIKLKYYKDELVRWHGYCYDDAEDPDFN